jgi:hypothetical protein
LARTAEIKASSSDSSVATVDPASGRGPGPLTFTVTDVKSRQSTITVASDGESAQIKITVS